MEKTEKNQNENKGTLKALFRMMGKHGWLFACSVLALIIAVSLEAAGRMIIRFIVDEALSDSMVVRDILKIVILFLGCAVVQGLFSFLSGRWKTRTAENVAREIRERLYDHIQRLSFNYHDRSPVGELVQRATSDVDAVRRFYAEQIPGFLQITFKFVIYFIALYLVHPRLALLASIIAPVITVLSTFFFGRIYKAYNNHQEQEGKVSSMVQENLHGIRVVRAFAQQKRENKTFDGINKDQRKAGLKVVMWHASYWPFAHALCGMQFIGAVVFSGILVLRGELTVGTMISSTFLFNGLIWPMQELGRMITEISHSFVSFQRIDEIMQEDREEIRDGDLVEAAGIKGDIDFRKVGFSYVTDAPVLNDISFSCKSGEKIALLGETGSGKTSIVNLLPRFYDYDSGEILLDGRPLKSYSRALLRQNIGIVEQNPFLFTMSIKENIGYSVARDVSLEEVIKVAKAASVHDSIMDFPEQYETLVGEKGVSLSGGQKQRIAIARTLLKDPRILILDDSTSAVDAETEVSIRLALEELMKERTTFIIAHRIQTLKEADKILVLKQGKIIQAGNHEQLAQMPGFYQDVFELQTRIEAELEQELAG